MPDVFLFLVDLSAFTALTWRCPNMTLIGCVVTFLTLFGGMMESFVVAFGLGCIG